VDWKSLHAAKQAEIQRLTRVRVSEVTPSIRNFAQYVTTHKQDLAFIAALKRVDPQTGRSWNDRDLVALAQEGSHFNAVCDDLKQFLLSESDENPAHALANDLKIKAREEFASQPEGGVVMDFLFVSWGQK